VAAARARARDERAIVEVLALGIGNVLWADEGFGVRAVEALHAGWVFPEGVRLIDGGTLGLELFDEIASAERLLVLRRDRPRAGRRARSSSSTQRRAAWSGRRLSPHQNGLNDVLALAALRGRAPREVTAIGVQPVYARGLRRQPAAEVKARVPEAVALASTSHRLLGLRADAARARLGVRAV
jgi:hydrogenase maturation protease